MSRPLPVAVTRPEVTTAGWVGRVIGYALELALSAVIVMWAAEEVTTWGLGFTDSLWIVLASKTLLPGSSHMYWTHPWSKGRTR